LTLEQQHAAMKRQKESEESLRPSSSTWVCVGRGDGQMLSQLYDVPYVDLDGMEVDPEVIKLIPIESAIRYQIRRCSAWELS
jgi:hypothetical protein